MFVDSAWCCSLCSTYVGRNWCIRRHARDGRVQMCVRGGRAGADRNYIGAEATAGQMWTGADETDSMYAVPRVSPVSGDIPTEFIVRCDWCIECGVLSWTMLWMFFVWLLCTPSLVLLSLRHPDSSETHCISSASSCVECPCRQESAGSERCAARCLWSECSSITPFGRDSA